MSNTYGFVPLGRTFRTLPQKVEDDGYETQGRSLLGRELTWSDILERHRVVILSEAGAGKTAEIREQARRLRMEGRAAFFIRLEHAADEFESAFEEGTLEEFQTWVAGADEAWFLLDSIDEARLRSPSDFETAVRKVAHRLAPAMARARVVITGRPYAWRAKTDLALCERQLPVDLDRASPESTEDLDAKVVQLRVEARTEEPFTIVALNDLSVAQVEQFAAARGVTSVSAFRDAVARADAWSFAARPQDLEELLEFWSEKGRIGSRLELMRTSVRRRLEEIDPNRAEAHPLTRERAEIGGRLVAAACSLTRTPTIRVPGGDATAGVLLDELLPDWDAKGHAALLARPIFDESIYGAVRFHHRSVREYLCAEWLSSLLKGQTSRRTIEQLLFRDQYGMEVVVPETRSVLPWLAIFDEQVCAKVLKLAPEAFFEGGDPSALPLDVRRKILHDVIAQIAAGSTSRSLTDLSGIERFASPELTDDVKALIATHRLNGDALWFLLRMIWQGRLVGALPAAKAVAVDPKAEHYARIAGFAAVEAISTAEMEDVRRAFVLESEELNRGWLAELLSGLEPTSDALTWLFEALAKASPKDAHMVDNLGYALDALVKRLPQDLLVGLLNRAAELLDQPPYTERRHCELSQKFAWLLRPAGAAALRLVESRSTEALAPSVLTVLEKIPVALDYDRADVSEISKQFHQLVPTWPELDWALFWRLIETERRWLDAKNGERLTRARFAALWSSFVRFGASDFDDALAFMDTRPLLDDQLVALSVAFDAYVSAGRGVAARRRLKKAAQRAPELQQQLALLLKPPPQSSEALTFKKTEADWKRRAKMREQKQARQSETNKRYLQEHLDDAVRAPDRDPASGITNAQHYLMNEANRLHGESDTHYARNTWRALISEFGEPVAKGFRDAAVGYWRKAKPQLVSEGAPQNSTLVSTIFGLVGLTIEASETVDWPNTLEEWEVELAFRYAMRELNGFPPWLPSLFDSFPTLVRDLALGELRYEVGRDAADQETHYLLSDVSWGGQWLWDATAPALARMIGHREPKNINNLRKLLAIMQGSSLPDEALAELAKRRARRCRNLDHAAVWFAVWTGVDPDAAIPALRERLERTRGRTRAANFAMTYVTQLAGSRLSRSAARSAYRTPDILKSLFLLVRTYVSEDEDIDRAGKGAYSPGLRDEAQDARNGLFSQLRDMPGKSAFTAMMEIASGHPNASFRTWAMRSARSKAESDSNGEPWSTRQVREFNDVLERTPGNHRELFDLAVMRLEDLKADLEEGDASEASVLMRVKDETELRNVLGNRLRLTAHGRYSVVQEEEYADAKRADLRFHAIALDAPVPVELKLSHRWTAKTLFERLENQLCGDYLRDVRSGRGVFVIIHQGKQSTWVLPDGSGPVDFNGLVAALIKHWPAIAGRFAGVDEVKVIGIDLTRRARGDS